MPRKRKLYLFQYGPTESYAVSRQNGLQSTKERAPLVIAS